MTMVVTMVIVAEQGFRLKRRWCRTLPRLLVVGPVDERRERGSRITFNDTEPDSATAENQ